MRPLLTAAGLAACVAAFLAAGHAADRKPAPVPQPAAAPANLVVHEWGTFTSFSGSDGVPARFAPNNTDLPDFVYVQGPSPFTKAARLHAAGTVSMETPVVYFYTDRDTRASVKVDFPRGWITEWYPAPAVEPDVKTRAAGGQTIRWDVRLSPGDTGRLPGRDGDENHYYEARQTDAVPVLAEVPRPAKEQPDPALQGGTVLQREKFLFYRGVGTFPPPVTVKALGDGRVTVLNKAGGRVPGPVLVSVQGGKVGFAVLPELAAGGEAVATIPPAAGSKAELADVLVKELTAAGLYEKEAVAMVRTWDDAWLGEDGTRLLYLVPRPKTDELLPLTIDPKPTEVVRVLVGRHDFLTPEQEVMVDRALKRSKAAQAELQAAEAELRSVGRFAWEARGQAEQRAEPKPGK